MRGKPSKLIDLQGEVRHPLLRGLVRLLQKPIEKTLALHRINRAYDEARFDQHESADFFRVALRTLRIDYRLLDDDLRKIPTEKPLVVVANHPYGGVEGIVLGDAVMRARQDVKILGNYLLQRIPELRPWVIPVDPFDNPNARGGNAAALKEAIRWVEQGGALVTFPAGEVSHLSPTRRRVTDPEWSVHMAAIVQRSKATVLPIYFPGRNGFLFQLMGLLHPRLRTAMLPREFVNKRYKTLELAVGKPLPWRKLKEFGDRQSLIDYLRVSTYFLEHRFEGGEHRHGGERPDPDREAVIEPVDSEALAREVDELPEECLLVEASPLKVFLATRERIPNMLREIGRLREVTFREVGEGTGRSMDIDGFDDHYRHLFLWNDKRKELAGAYRLGLADEIVRDRGVDGLYTSTLFQYQPGFAEKLGSAIEFGRSFIVPQYQKKQSCLALIWRGIGEFIVRNPRYHILFGPVSISQDYHAVSRALMVQFLQQHKMHEDLSGLVSPRRPFVAPSLGSMDAQSIRNALRDIDDVSVLISEIEDDGKGVPVLLRHYLKLNAKLISFNLDEHFSDVVDGLIVVDLLATDPRLIKRFLGADGTETFLRRHREALRRDAAPLGV